MRLFFEGGPKGAYGRGWYRFFLAIPEVENPIVFRMPEESPKDEIVHRARTKLFFRYGEQKPFRISDAEEVHVVRWLMDHKKKADLGEKPD